MKFLLAFSASAALIAMTGTTTVDAIGFAGAGFVNVPVSVATIVDDTNTQLPETNSAAGLRLRDETKPHPALTAIAAH